MTDEAEARFLRLDDVLAELNETSVDGGGLQEGAVS